MVLETNEGDVRIMYVKSPIFFSPFVFHRIFIIFFLTRTANNINHSCRIFFDTIEGCVGWTQEMMSNWNLSVVYKKQ